MQADSVINNTSCGVKVITEEWT